LEKHGLSLDGVKSLEALEPLLRTIKAQEPGVYPLEACLGESPPLPFRLG
jgi:putative aldouronate transport system substrate-binding protein